MNYSVRRDGNELHEPSREARKMQIPVSGFFDSVPPDFLSLRTAVARSAGGLCGSGLAAGGGSLGMDAGGGSGHRDSSGHRRAGYASLSFHPNLIAAEVLALGRPHLGHGRIGLGVIIISIPEKKADAALLFRNLDLHLDIFRRIRLRAPGKGLQPGTNRSEER